MKFETLLVEAEGAIGYLTLNRPERMNALSPLVLRELAAAARWFDEQFDVRVVVVRGAGRAFCAGADLKARQMFTDASQESNWIKRREMGQLGDGDTLISVRSDPASLEAAERYMQEAFRKKKAK